MPDIRLADLSFLDLEDVPEIIPGSMAQLFRHVGYLAVNDRETYAYLIGQAEFTDITKDEIRGLAVTTDER